MAHPRKTISDLLRRACDTAATSNEKASCFEALRKRLERLPPDEVHALARAIEAEGSNSAAMAGAGQEVRHAMEIEAARAAQRADDEMLCRAAAASVREALFELPEDVRCSEIGSNLGSLIFKATAIQSEAIRAGHPPKDMRKLERVVVALGNALRETRSVRLEDRQHTLENVVAALFRANPVQPGADAIAKKIGWRASEVRDHLKNLVATGEVEAIGRGGARRYRRCGADRA